VTFTKLRDVFIEKLREEGVERVGTKIRKILTSPDPLTLMAVYVANGRANVCRAVKPLPFSITLSGKFVEMQPQAYIGDCDSTLFTKEDLLKNRRFPYILVDCRFWDRHSEKEKKKLVIQLRQTLGVVRKYMWDEQFVITGNIDPEKCFGIYHSSTEDFLNERRVEDIILLDPGAEDIFQGEKADCYIIGGIVDKTGNKSGLTSKIGEELKKSGFYVKRRKIVLKGDITGVPDRINHIAEIVLRVTFDGVDVERAVMEIQPPVVARWRLRKELKNYTLRVKSKSRVFRVVPKRAFENFDWLNLKEEDFYEVASDYRYIVISERLLRMMELG
jgi:tRNA (adenine9-N1/guanine9-N1)-methyltransferase